MAGTTDTLKAINSFIRTVLATIVVGGASVLGWFGYNQYNEHELELQRRDQQIADAAAQIAESKQQLEKKQAEIVTLGQELEKKAEEILRLDTALRLLKVDHRLARLTVLEQQVDPQTKAISTTVEFVEVDDLGQPLEQPRTFTFKGDLVYIDNWIVKFEDRYVEEAELSRSTSIVLFRRIFGEHQEPVNGLLLEDTKRPPRAYSRGTIVTDFERKIWTDFWNIANDEARAKELGIRAAHGEAVSIKTQKGKTYKLLLRASDGLSIVPENGPNKTAI